MNFLDIASIVFICTAANHIGPIPDIEAFIKRKLPVIGCIKCLTFWSVLVYGFSVGFGSVEAAITILAISFLSSWSAIWLDLFMGTIDHIYIKIYEQIYPTADIADPNALSPDNALPDVPDIKS